MFDFPEDMVAARDLRLSLALNLAAVSLKLEEWGKAAAYASKALDVDPDNLKAIYRRGQVRWWLATFCEVVAIEFGSAALWSGSYWNSRL